MTKITYVEADGNTTIVDVPDGWSLMQGAVSNGVKGIIGACGGSCSCGTCHCYVDEAWVDKLPTRSSIEMEILETVAAEFRANSRLACQITASPAIEGLVVRLPERQE
ncbi:MAG TPA: 2Fe-2S iron-sulfur cluster-binding protein [Terriglobales bacterium]|nr:2Fe-2S iron-sulfur cluster-binding protein [Terriglobales bacterium]